MATSVLDSSRAQRVLVVDDEKPIVEALAYSLRKEGFSVLTAGSGEEGLHLARTTKPDLIILDIMLPAASGFQVCRVLRKESDVPIIMLTAKGEEEDRVLGLDLGADDYMTKPFSIRELIARVRTHLRRQKGPTGRKKPISVADVHIDPVKHRVTVRGEAVELTPKEFKLLSLLAGHPDQVVSRDTLLDRVWGEEAFVDQRTVDVHVRWLRTKVEEDPSNPKRILTQRGFGYKFSSE
ncbi:MAG: response regulator transcription factor [Armatimonadetes bacterium]|nr:response regulator transcription factor [Armatimonadota bacterium]